MTRATLLRAAELLEEDAEVLRRSYADRDGQWSSDPIDRGVQAEHDERIEIAGKLRSASPQSTAEIERLKVENEALRKDAALRRAVNRAAAELPDYYAIDVSIELGAATVTLCTPNGRGIDIDVDADDRLVAEIHAAIDAALAARRTDGL